jgi:hypothetical protein
MKESRCDIADYFTRSHDSVGRPATTLRHSPLYVLFRTLDRTAPADTQSHTDISKQFAVGCGVDSLAVHTVLGVDEQFSLSGSVRLRVLVHAGRTEPTHTKYIHSQLSYRIIYILKYVCMYGCKLP